MDGDRTTIQVLAIECSRPCTNSRRHSPVHSVSSSGNISLPIIGVLAVMGQGKLVVVLRKNFEPVVMWWSQRWMELQTVDTMRTLTCLRTCRTNRKWKWTGRRRKRRKRRKRSSSITEREEEWRVWSLLCWPVYSRQPSCLG